MKDIHVHIFFVTLCQWKVHKRKTKIIPSPPCFECELSERFLLLVQNITKNVDRKNLDIEIAIFKSSSLSLHFKHLRAAPLNMSLLFKILFYFYVLITM